MLIGEAPGEEEEKEGEPFVGKAGTFLTRYLGRAGLERSDVYFGNLCQRRPLFNEFRNVLGSDELTTGLQILQDDIKRIKPNVIIALGNWPMYFLSH